MSEDWRLNASGPGMLAYDNAQRRKKMSEKLLVAGSACAERAQYMTATELEKMQFDARNQAMRRLQEHLQAEADSVGALMEKAVFDALKRSAGIPEAVQRDVWGVGRTEDPAYIAEQQARNMALRSAVLESMEPEPATPQPTGIGSISSQEAGSAARYNAGKPAMELVPLRLIAAEWMRIPSTSDLGGKMMLLADFQEGGDIESLSALMCLLGFPWRDCAKVFDFGRKKYAEWNWAKGMPWSAVIGSAARHLMDMRDGEVNDRDSGLPHAGHLMCNLVMLMTYARTYPQGDDRTRLLVRQESKAGTPE